LYNTEELELEFRVEVIESNKTELKGKKGKRDIYKLKF
jgi:hypothetical protein